MIVYPNAKINIGLNIVGKRPDGFHNIETVFYPINLTDILEVVSSDEQENGISLATSGIQIDSRLGENLCEKAYQKLKKLSPQILPAKAHLHKIIPIGAGLGGGSADASFMLKLLNDYFKLNHSSEILRKLASEIGSDCAFFIDNTPSFAHGRGELLKPIDLSLKGYKIQLINPGIHISTQLAYSGVQPSKPEISLEELVLRPPENWKDKIKNDFETHIFKMFPDIENIKNNLYRAGAVYASMSGSGSSVYGIFSETNKLPNNYPADYFVWNSE